MIALACLFFLGAMLCVREEFINGRKIEALEDESEEEFEARRMSHRSNWRG